MPTPLFLHFQKQQLLRSRPCEFLHILQCPKVQKAEGQLQQVKHSAQSEIRLTWILISSRLLTNYMTQGEPHHPRVFSFGKWGSCHLLKQLKGLNEIELPLLLHISHKFQEIIHSPNYNLYYHYVKDFIGRLSHCVFLFCVFQSQGTFPFEKIVIAHEWSQLLGPLTPCLLVLPLPLKTTYCVQWETCLDPFQLYQVHFLGKVYSTSIQSLRRWATNGFSMERWLLELVVLIHFKIV